MASLQITTKLVAPKMLPHSTRNLLINALKAVGIEFQQLNAPNKHRKASEQTDRTKYTHREWLLNVSSQVRTKNGHLILC
jgi:hypothetical protein